MAERGAILRLALASLANRRATVLLTVFSIAVSVALLAGVERIRKEARSSFESTISGTDLIVGARSGPLQLLLYTVFRIGSPTNNVTWESYQAIARSALVAWTIPISLGDSHRGYRVLGTTQAYFDHYRFGSQRPLELAAGRAFAGVYETVLGAEVARELAYGLGTEIVIAHGVGKASFAQHDAYPFTVVGILERTGTPVDQTVHVPLAAIDAIHDGPAGVPQAPGAAPPEERGATPESEPSAITAFFVGLDNRLATFRMQRAINEYPEEPLLAILPGVALQELWGLVGVAETALLAVSAFVIVAGLLGLLAAILTSLNERRREMAILRSVGARPAHVALLLLSEAGLTAAAGAVLGIAGQHLLVFFARGPIEERLGIVLAQRWPGAFEAIVIVAVTAAAVLLALWPAWRAYRNSLADGLTIRI